MIEKTEQIVLGTIIAFKDYQDIMISELHEKYFSLESHKLIFGCISKLYSKGTKIDLLTINAALSKDELKKMGGIAYISSLTSIVSGINTDKHIRIVKQEYIRRNLVTLFTDQLTKLAERTHDIADTQIEVSNSLDDLFNVSTDDMANMFDIIGERLNNYSDVQPGKLLGIETGHSKLNKITNGWQAGDLIILAARPSMGKTAVSLLFAKYPALNKKKVVYFSLEMPKERIADRIISLETNIDSSKLQSGRIEDYQWEQLDIHTMKYSGTELLINDESGLTIEQIKASSLKELSKGKIALILVDYIQLIRFSGNSNPNVETGHISKNLKSLAKKCNCPIIALSQLNRDVEKRPSKRPILSDLRDSGTLEQDADVVIFLYRPEYYGYVEDQNGNSIKNIIEADVKKNRNGALGSTNFYKNEDWSYIGEMSKEELDSFEIPFNTMEGIEHNF